MELEDRSSKTRKYGEHGYDNIWIDDFPDDEFLCSLIQKY